MLDGWENLKTFQLQIFWPDSNGELNKQAMEAEDHVKV